MKGLVIKSTGFWYTIKSGDTQYEARLRGRFRLENKKITNPVAVGDRVEIKPNHRMENEWVITKIYERENYVLRKSPRKKGHDHLIASNVDQGVLIATLKMPRTSIGFIDRFLVSLEAFRIPGVILFNKTDLYSKDDLEQINELIKIYEPLGYSILSISLQNEKISGELHSLLSNKISLISGHSGAGKSTFVNQLVPDAKQEVKEISGFANKGVHTTTFAQLFEIDPDTMIIDTPGIKELNLAEIEKEELFHYFPEMRKYLGLCKFHNCLHNDEPGCAIKKKIGTDISITRYESYLSILLNEDNRR